MICRYWALVFAVLWTAPACAAGSVPESPGRWALQFGIGSHGTVTAFGKSSIALAYHASPAMAVRTRVDIRLVRQHGKGVDQETLDEISLRDDHTDVSTAVDVLLYPRPRDPVRLFFGVGPYYEVSRVDTEHPDRIYAEIHEDLERFGGRLSVGAEWSFCPSMSLHAEYNLRFLTRTWEESGIVSGADGKREYKNEEDAWEISAAGVLFGISVGL